MWSISLHFFTPRGSQREVAGGNLWGGRGNRRQFCGSVTTASVGKCVCVRLTFAFINFFSEMILLSPPPILYAPPVCPAPSTDSEANKPQSRSKMKVNIFMNGFFFFPPVSAETPEVYKNNGVCNIIPSTVNRSCLKEGFWRRGGGREGWGISH